MPSTGGPNPPDPCQATSSVLSEPQVNTSSSPIRTATIPQHFRLIVSSIFAVTSVRTTTRAALVVYAKTSHQLLLSRLSTRTRVPKASIQDSDSLQALSKTTSMVTIPLTAMTAPTLLYRILPTLGMRPRIARPATQFSSEKYQKSSNEPTTQPWPRQEQFLKTVVSLATVVLNATRALLTKTA